MNISKEWIENKIEIRELEIKIRKLQNNVDNLDNMMKYHVAHYGISHTDDFEAGCDWWVFKPIDDKKLEDALAKLNIYEDRDRGIYDANDWDCSGKCMRDRPKIKRTKTRVLVTQSWAYDFQEVIK